MASDGLVSARQSAGMLALLIDVNFEIETRREQLVDEARSASGLKFSGSGTSSPRRDADVVTVDSNQSPRPVTWRLRRHTRARRARAASCCGCVTSCRSAYRRRALPPSPLHGCHRELRIPQGIAHCLAASPRRRAASSRAPANSGATASSNVPMESTKALMKPSDDRSRAAEDVADSLRQVAGKRRNRVR